MSSKTPHVENHQNACHYTNITYKVLLAEHVYEVLCFILHLCYVYTRGPAREIAWDPDPLCRLDPRSASVMPAAGPTQALPHCVSPESQPTSGPPCTCRWPVVWSFCHYGITATGLLWYRYIIRIGVHCLNYCFAKLILKCGILQITHIQFK